MTVKSNAKFFFGDTVQVGVELGLILRVDRFFRYRGWFDPPPATGVLTPVGADEKIPVGDNTFLGEEFSYGVVLELSGSSKLTFDEEDLILVERGWFWRKAHGEHLYALIRTPSTCPKSIEFMHGKIADVNAAVKARNKVLRKNPYVTLLVKKVVFATQQGECNGY